MLLTLLPTSAFAFGAWKDTGLTLGMGFTLFHPTQPWTLLESTGEGTVAHNWRTGESKLVSALQIEAAGSDGTLYGLGAGNSPHRFTLADPAGAPIEQRPTHIAEDGTAQVYALSGGRLWYSADAARTWQERSLPAAFESVTLAYADARVLYGLVVTGRTGGSADTVTYEIYASQDAGATWDRRMGGTAVGAWTGGPRFTLVAPQTVATPVGTLVFYVDPGYPGSSNQVQVYTTNDGAQTLNQQPANGLGSWSQYTHSHEGIVRISTFGYGYSLTLSRDGGRTWENLARTPNGARLVSLVGLAVAPSAPANIFIKDSDALWRSKDGGHSWMRMDRANGLPLFTPYLPLNALDFQVVNGLSRRVEVQQLDDAGPSLTRPIASIGTPGGEYHPQTGHTLSGPLLRYWKEHGGLAQFGYPRTPAFRELNPADNTVYTVQYLERNRVEYHPEHAGTQYEVLLGLLGVQQTEQRHGDDPFQPRTGTPEGRSDCTFYAQTGHSLCGSFRTYWQQHGGLAIYGYPITEEFFEVNPDDGRTYLVQYYERARFEWHPEHEGTPYEVLLGLLGNAVLRQKGWM